MSGAVIGFAGMTHLGINSAVAAAARGFSTLCFDPDAELIASLDAGKIPVVEPDLAEVMAGARERLHFTADANALGKCDIVYIASDVPTDGAGTSDLRGIRLLIDDVSARLSRDAILVVLCQVPPGFTRALAWPQAQLIYQVETLIFGRAVERAMHPERVIIGCSDTALPLPAAYREFLSAFECPLLTMRYESAELAKIAINCCLVSSVTIANTLAELSERIGADWNEIVPALKLDRRIGPHAYLAPGLGLAGGNLERDLATVLALAQETGTEAGVVRSFIANSQSRKDWVLRVLHDEVLGQTSDPAIAVLGLAYKENTHSTKNSPALGLLSHLEAWRVRIYDPVVPAEVAAHPRAEACVSALDAATGADALVVMTPWDQFRELQAPALMRIMKGRIVIDPLRVLDGKALSAEGFSYFTLGTPPLRPSRPAQKHA
jgi:UDPglucose 6-dehydrogenase